MVRSARAVEGVRRAWATRRDRDGTAGCWRWSVNVKPIAGTDSCQVDHLGYVLEGRMALRMDDGTEREFGPGDAFHVPPGHDAWIIGDEACVLLDLGGLRG
jgi:uncharacterized cupin superfamily protein